MTASGDLAWWRPDPPGRFTRLWDRVPDYDLLLTTAVHDVRWDGGELITGISTTGLRRVSTDPAALYRHLCQVLGQPSTAETSVLGDRLPAERWSDP